MENQQQQNEVESNSLQICYLKKYQRTNEHHFCCCCCCQENETKRESPLHELADICTSKIVESTAQCTVCAQRARSHTEYEHHSRMERNELAAWA